ncbi:hypothetical protein KCU88_g1624, partial [Aureobasidium melanogenum]
MAKLEKRIKARETASIQPRVITKPTDVSFHRQVGELQGSGFERFSKGDLEGPWDEIAEHDTTVSERKHPSVMPIYPEEIESHFKAWLEWHNMNISSNKLAVYCEWFDQQFKKSSEDWLFFAGSFGNPSKQPSEAMQTYQDDRILLLRRGFATSVEDMCSQLLFEIEHFGGTDLTMDSFKKKQHNVRKIFSDFEIRVANLYDWAYSGDILDGIDLDAARNTGGEEYVNFEGALLPSQTNPAAQLPRLAWPKVFEEFYQKQGERSSRPASGKEDKPTEHTSG